VSEQRIGKYRLVSLLASGGMGEVFLARMEGPAGFARTVVIKKILPHLAREQAFVQMFLDEARVAAQLTHPNIVQVIELGEHEGTWFMAMEYVHGKSARTLRQELKAKGEVMPPLVVARILSQALQGLHYAHTATSDVGVPLNVIHRDVSPDNVMVAYSGAVKVLDFGIAKAADVLHTTRTGTVKGKYAYMAPEQLLAEALDPRADVYAAGVVAYELLAGKRPYTAPSEAALVKRILDSPPAPLSEVAPHVPPQLAAIVAKALEKDRNLRHASAEAFAVELEEWIAAQPTDPGLSLPAFMRARFSTQSGEFPAVVTPSNPQAAAAALLAPAIAPGSGPLSAPVLASAEFTVDDDATRPARGGPRRSSVAPLAAGLMAGALAVATLAVVVWKQGEAAEPIVTAAAPEVPDAAGEVPDAAVAAVTAVAAEPDAGELAAAAPEPEVHDAGAARAPEPRPTKAPAGKGRLDLRVNPWAEVFEGAKSLGLTPAPPLELPAGRHTLTLKNDKLQISRTVHVHIAPGKTTTLRVDLLEAP